MHHLKGAGKCQPFFCGITKPTRKLASEQLSSLKAEKIFWPLNRRRFTRRNHSFIGLKTSVHRYGLSESPQPQYFCHRQIKKERSFRFFVCANNKLFLKSQKI